MKFLILVLCFSCVNLALCKKTFRAGVYRAPQRDFDVTFYDFIIQEAAKENIDILVLPSPDVSILDVALENSSFRPENYNKIVSAISSSAKKAGIYVAAHLYDKDVTGLVKTNVVVDRRGAVIFTYRKPINNIANTTSEVGSFTSNFGVLFAVLTEDDLVLHNVGNLKNVHNFIVLGASNVESTYLGTSELLSSWAYTTKANFITENYIYGDNIKKIRSKLLTADLNKEEAQFINIPQVRTADLENVHDFTKYTIKPLDIESSAQGYEDTVCHHKNCCNFYVKSSFAGSLKNSFNYGLAVFNGLQSYGDHNIGVHNCVVFAYTGLYKHAVDFGNNKNNSAMKFNSIIISYNVTDTYVTNLPTLVSARSISNTQFDFNTRFINGNKRITVEVANVEDVSLLGIFGRNHTKDFLDVKNKNGDGKSLSWDIYDYINSERIQDCFDYLWITLRILLFIVSIYILEMM